ncbi:SDR family oxidoreductase [Bacillus marinisedimentorum]|uniref:SDR family oxidoreductase n=1 Tax=Bacillus marinisedimentorum TaxID=1821260 RepID=UPI0008731B2A|nr:SDR family oxidoreductase [Bacillus marinisedimentorum]
MGNTYFFTGFPGFIARALLKELSAEDYTIDHIYLLVQPQMAETARQEIASLARSTTLAEDSFTIIEGDITKPNLDMDEGLLPELQSSITHVFHLAAVYDLAVPKKIAYNVNVNGTKRVNDWVLTLDNIDRYVYFSTAFVSGDREGRILESELEMGQSFKNHYESTKYEAELLVRGIMERVPTTVIRPGIVKGHSRTGETIKFDGPYFILNLLDAMKFSPIIPYFGSGDAFGNFVPVDYIIEAVIYLAHQEKGAGKTYHLTDPNPFKVKDVYRLLMKESLGKKPTGTIPLPLAAALLRVKPVRKWLKVEREAMDYFACKSFYDSSQALADLKDSGIKVPSFASQVGPMVSFYLENKSDRSKHVAIR